MTTQRISLDEQLADAMVEASTHSTWPFNIADGAEANRLLRHFALTVRVLRKTVEQMRGGPYDGDANRARLSALDMVQAAREGSVAENVLMASSLYELRGVANSLAQMVADHLEDHEPERVDAYLVALRELFLEDAEWGRCAQ